jgi:hypothetical protein
MDRARLEMKLPGVDRESRSKTNRWDLLSHLSHFAWIRIDRPLAAPGMQRGPTVSRALYGGRALCSRLQSRGATE